MQAWFISDIHIKNINERNSILLLRFLHFLENNRRATHLFLLGDIFDLWVGDSQVFEKKFRPIVDAILRLKDRGMEVIYFEGNHDVHIKRYWQDRFSIPVFVDYQILQLGQWKVRLEHGDYINPEDLSYIKYLETIRSKKLEFVAYHFPGVVFDYLGNLASRKSRKRSSQYRKDSEQSLKEKIRKFAIRSAELSEFDFLITGHMHIRDEFVFKNGGAEKVSINLGSWFDTPSAFCLEEDSYRWQVLT